MRARLIAVALFSIACSVVAWRVLVPANARTIAALPLDTLFTTPSVIIAPAPTGDDALAGIADVALRHDGAIVLLDPRSRRVMIHDSGGRFIRTLGGRGDGPGELVRPDDMTLLPNGGVAVSDGSQRIVTWKSDGIPGPVLRTTGVIVGLASSSDALFVKEWLPRRHYSQVLRYGFPLGFPPQIVWSDRPRNRSLFQPQTAYESCAICPFAVSHDGEVALAMSPTDFTIEVINADGRRTTISKDFPRVPVPPDRIERNRRRAAAMGRQLRIPEFEALVARVFYDDRGRLWIRRRIAYGKDGYVFEAYRSSDGAALATIDRGSADIRAIRSNQAVAVATDSLGVESIIAYSLRKRAP